MARPLRIQFPGAVYHLMCRGNQRNKIFLDSPDRAHFLSFLRDSLETYHVTLYVYVLRANHFHLVVRTLRANLSEFMRRFNICYTGWFNHRHQTCGHLYQGRYKALVVDTDNYLLELSRYVHLNPVSGKTFQSKHYKERWKYISTFQWSSLLGYVDKQKAVDFVDYDLVLGMIGGRRVYKQFLMDGLKEGLVDVFRDVKYQAILGDDDFVSRMKGEFVRPGSLCEQPNYRSLVQRPLDPKDVLSVVAVLTGIPREQFSLRRANDVARGIAAELLYRYSQLTQREIGQMLGGISYTGVSMLRKRLQNLMSQDRSIQDDYLKAQQGVQRLSEE